MAHTWCTIVRASSIRMGHMLPTRSAGVSTAIARSGAGTVACTPWTSAESFSAEPFSAEPFVRLCPTKCLNLSAPFHLLCVIPGTSPVSELTATAVTPSYNTSQQYDTIFCLDYCRHSRARHSYDTLRTWQGCVPLQRCSSSVSHMPAVSYRFLSLPAVHIDVVEIFFGNIAHILLRVGVVQQYIAHRCKESEHNPR